MHSSVSTPLEDVDKIYSRHRLFLKKYAWLYSGDTLYGRFIKILLYVYDNNLFRRW